MKQEKLTRSVQSALSEAQSIAITRDHTTLMPIHLLGALAREQGGMCLALLANMGVDSVKFQALLAEQLEALPRIGQATGEVTPDRTLLRWLNLAEKKADELGDQYVSVDALLLTACDADTDLKNLFEKLGVQACLKGVRQINRKFVYPALCTLPTIRATAYCFGCGAFQLLNVKNPFLWCGSAHQIA